MCVYILCNSHKINEPEGVYTTKKKAQEELKKLKVNKENEPYIEKFELYKEVIM